MSSSHPEEENDLSTLPTVGIGETAQGFASVKQFLARFGYLAEAPRAGERRGDELEETTALALASYQTMHGLSPTGLFDDPTRDMMTRARCAVPDLTPSTGARFSITCQWPKDTLTYAFAAGTGDVGGNAEQDAVRRAFATWTASAQIAFREVTTSNSPDIHIAWTAANCGDTDMTGTTLAHADYPPGCGYYGNALPRPIHFDDQENTWCIGAVAGQFDVETVALHEIGHILGLSHSSVAGAVMFPTTSPNATVRALASDDIEGIRRLYPIRGPIFARHSGRCLDIESASTAKGADAIQWDYLGGVNQIFRAEWVENGHYRLIATHSGRVLDIDRALLSNGAQVHQWEWLGGDNQKFKLEPVGHGYYRVTPKHSGKCLDVAGGSAGRSARVIQWEWLGGGNQQWRLGPAQIAVRHSRLALDVAGVSAANGAAITQWAYWGGGNQRFRLDPVGNGFYRIIIEHSGKCLDVERASMGNGARIIQWEYWGGDNQKFRPEFISDGFYQLVAKHSGKCLDVERASTANGAQVIQWGYTGGMNQQWRL